MDVIDYYLIKILLIQLNKKIFERTLFISNSEIVNQFNRPYNIRKALEKTIKNEFTPK